jgi:dTDP-4-amino-4,6-dideoxygalactose transaminase
VASPSDAIALVDLKAQYQAIRPEVDAAIQAVVERGDFTLGAAVESFERDFAAYCGAAYGVGVASGTDALFLAMRALGLGPGDEVIVPTMTFAATAEAVVYCGAQPVFVDVQAADLQIDVQAVARSITPRTRGIVPVHLFGLLAPVEPLAALAEQHGLWLLEDAAQAHGATLPNGQRVGSIGRAACFSFYPSKNLGAYGDGGMVVTNDPALADEVRALRHHGQRTRYEHSSLGYCSRLDNLQAAVLRVKLGHLDEWNVARQNAASRYDALLDGKLDVVGRNQRQGPVHHVYAVRIPGGHRDRVAEQMQRQGIGVGVHYPIPLHLQPVFQPITTGASFPVAELAAAEVLSLPLFPEITAEQQQRVVETLLAALNG